MYFDGGRLSLDKKTGKQMWTMKLVIACKAEEMTKCDEVVLNNWIAIETLENRIEEVILAHEIEAQAVEFFGLSDHTAPVLYIKADLTDLSLTREADLTELHFKIETENTSLVHNFIREFVFTKFWAQFAPWQRALPFEAATRKPQKEPRGNKRVN